VEDAGLECTRTILCSVTDGSIILFIRSIFIRYNFYTDKMYTVDFYTLQNLNSAKFIRFKVYTGSKFIRFKIYTVQNLYDSKFLRSIFINVSKGLGH
jgi:hypothetical protein